jgi:hypothetical protein
MDYDDIAKIADAITDDIDANNGLPDGVSMSVFEPPQRAPRRQTTHTPDDYYDLDSMASFNPPSSTARSVVPLVSRQGTKAKSVTMLETKGFRVVPSKSSQRIAPKPQPKPASPISKLGQRTLEI